MNMEITLKIKFLERREPKGFMGKDVLAFYNVIFESDADEKSPPGIKGVRLFQSDKDSSKRYIRMPQIRISSGRYFDVLKLPLEDLRLLEQLIIDDYCDQVSNVNDEISMEEIDKLFSQ